LWRLAHLNIRPIITQDGLLNQQEEAIRGALFLGISVLGDQNMNMGKASSASYGVMVEFTNDSK
jgi:hypothetical protein